MPSAFRAMDSQQDGNQQDRDSPREDGRVPKLVGRAQRSQGYGQEEHETEKAGDGEAAAAHGLGSKQAVPCPPLS
jgi:hypothetical protein